MNGTNRKQSALWTVGRASRGLLRCSDRHRDIILAGTALTSSENSIHILAVDCEAISLHPLNILTAPSEVWSLEVVAKDSNLNIIAATRKAYRSAVEVWSLTGADDLSPRISRSPSWDASGYDAHPIRNTSFMAIDGDILKVVKNHAATSSYMALTKTDATFLNVGASLQISLSLQLGRSKFPMKSEKDAFVDAGWIDENTAYIASTKCFAACDSRTGEFELVTDTEKSINTFASMQEGLLVAPFPTRISTTLSTQGTQLVVGGEDGSLRSYDLKKSDVIWEVPRAHAQWVSTLCETQAGEFLSGGMDGVVRCWTREGHPIATFPQHDDIVTNATSFDSAFVSVSYDGRLAMNELPTA
ncbi:WD40/YVTN repeat-like containing protein [Gracilaria domingensis]|nr:WD40/YVTN repeat-like containing protein [Gracilaria domingensis]